MEGYEPAIPIVRALCSNWGYVSTSGQVPNPEGAACVDSAALITVISTHMRQRRCREIDSRAGHHPVLYRNVFEKMVLMSVVDLTSINRQRSSSRRWSTSTRTRTPLCSNVPSKIASTSRFPISSRVARDRLIQVPLAANFDATGNVWRASSPTSRPCSMTASLAASGSVASSGW